MNSRIVASVLIMGATAAAPRAAAADSTKEQCIAADDAAQGFRQAGKLGKAREQLVLCVAQSCPGPVREDCAQRLDEVDKAMPTVVFEVKDGSGNDLSAVSVRMDGQPFAQTVGGAAVAVDPGEHHFVFEAPGSPSTEKVVVVREADKDRRVQVVLGSASTAPPVAAPPSSPEAPSDGSMQRMIGLVVGGAGVVGLVIGGVFGLVSKGTYSNALTNECGNNPNTCSNQGAPGFVQPDRQSRVRAAKEACSCAQAAPVEVVNFSEAAPVSPCDVADYCGRLASRRTLCRHEVVRREELRRAE